MRIGKQEKKQVKLVQDWNIMHSVGINVIVTKDDGTEERTKTCSAAYMLGASGDYPGHTAVIMPCQCSGCDLFPRDYPGHTAVIMLDGISGCYALERVREASP